jgi:arylsulfatase A-like enzyme
MEVPDYGQYKEKDWPEPQKGLASMITRMDEDIGHILAKLAELQIDKNTIVFFSSDNGPHQEGRNDPGFFNSNGPLRGIKRDLYEGGIRVPFVVRWPGKIKANTKSDHMTAFWDFLPTCAELAGHSSPEWVDGISLFPSLTNNEKEKHEYLYWEFPAQGGKRAIRIGSWKGVQLHVSKDPDGPIELYNLENDIGESNDVADEHPDIVERIRKMMQSVRTKSKSFSLFG